MLLYLGMPCLKPKVVKCSLSSVLPSIAVKRQWLGGIRFGGTSGTGSGGTRFGQRLVVPSLVWLAYRGEPGPAWPSCTTGGTRPWGICPLSPSKSASGRPMQAWPMTTSSLVGPAILWLSLYSNVIEYHCRCLCRYVHHDSVSM